MVNQRMAAAEKLDIAICVELMEFERDVCDKGKAKKRSIILCYSRQKFMIQHNERN